MTGKNIMIIGSEKIGTDLMIKVKGLPEALDAAGVVLIKLALGVGSVRIGSMLPTEAEF